MNDRLDLQRLTTAILRRWIVVLVVTVVIAELGYLVTSAQAATYEATTSVLVGQEPPGVIIENSDRATKEQLALTFAELAVRAPVLEPAAGALGINGNWRSLRSRVTVQLAPRTLLLDLHVTGKTPEAAAQAADEIADQLVAVTEDLSPYRQVKVGPARADPTPIGPNVQMNTLFAGIIGFIIASALALVLELVRERRKRAFRSQEDIPYLGVVRARRTAGPATVPDALASEEGAAILGNLRVACRPNPVRTIVVTGTSSAERSRVATQLAATLSHGGVPAALIDLGLRDPVIHRLCGLPLVPGVSELLEHRGPKRGVVRTVNEYLQVLPAGHPSVNPSLLLSPEAVERIVAHVGPFADVLVFDVPLTERISELGLVAERVDAVVLVIRNRLTRSEERRVGEDLTALGVRPNGLVVVRSGFFSRLTGRLSRPLAAGPHHDESDDALAVVDPEQASDPRPRARRKHEISDRSVARSDNGDTPADVVSEPSADNAMELESTTRAKREPKPRRQPAKRAPRKPAAAPELMYDDLATMSNGHDPRSDEDELDADERDLERRDR
ncbi:MAG: Wzz/FepE/Etk N-terminal domain-containing protein [Acidimicrobiia bacterium]